MKNIPSDKRRIQILLIFFMFGLIVSGLTAIPVYWEASILKQLFGSGTWFSNIFPGFSMWFEHIHDGVQLGYGQYPFLAYGNDWLAFGHVAIALAFIGPLRDPVKNIWVVEFGMLTCLLVIPWALIFSFVRDIPFFWTMIDMSFGTLGIIPLWLARRHILQMAANQPS